MSHLCPFSVPASVDNGIDKFRRVLILHEIWNQFCGTSSFQFSSLILMMNHHQRKAYPPESALVGRIIKTVFTEVACQVRSTHNCLFLNIRFMLPEPSRMFLHTFKFFLFSLFFTCKGFTDIPKLLADI